MPTTQPDRTGLDEVDLRLIAALGQDAEMTNKALAHRLGLAESTCAYRLRAMRDRGVIAGRRLVVDHAALGYPLQAIVKVRLGSHDEAGVTRLYEALVGAPGVLQAFFMSGADDFHLHVAVRDAEALRDLVLHHVTRHRLVRQTETQLVFEVREGVGALGGAGAAPRRR